MPSARPWYRIGDDIVQGHENRSADDRAQKQVDTAHHDHEHRLARGAPVGEFGVCPRHEQAHQDAAHTAEAPRHHERGETDPRDVDAQETGPVGIVAHHAQGVAEGRLQDMAHQQQAGHSSTQAKLYRCIWLARLIPRKGGRGCLISGPGRPR
jgi:hypothetical protein